MNRTQVSVAAALAVPPATYDNGGALTAMAVLVLAGVTVLPLAVAYLTRSGRVGIAVPVVGAALFAVSVGGDFFSLALWPPVVGLCLVAALAAWAGARTRHRRDHSPQR